MNICYLNQKAFVAVLDSAGLTTIPEGQIYKGIERPADANQNREANTRKSPCVIVECKESDVIAPTAGKWKGPVIIKVCSMCDDTTDEQHQERAVEVFNAIVTDTIAADLSAAIENYTASLVIVKRQGYEMVERRWESFLELEVSSCAADLE